MIQLDFSNKSKPATTTPRSDPVDVFRKALDQQIKAVEAQLKDDVYCIQRRRYHSGKPTYIDVPLRVWWWLEDDTYYLTLRYSSQVIRITGHESIKCGPLHHVKFILEQIRDALNESDQDVLAALQDAHRRTRWKKRSAIPATGTAQNAKHGVS
jgi:hypothetical protein